MSGGQFERTELGHILRRTVALDGDTVRIETTLQSVAEEISAAEADKARADALVRPYDPPRVFAPANYRTTSADRNDWQKDAPTTSSGWLDRALALSQSGDDEGAVDAADHAITLNPLSSAAWANRGVYRFWTGDREGAASDLEKAVDIDPSERVAMNGHALLAMANQKYDDAVVELSRALRQVPGDEFALSLRAQAYLQLKQYDRALRDIDSLIAASSTPTQLKMMRIGVLEDAGRTDQADAEMNALALAEPANWLVLLNQAAQKLERGQAQAAHDILDRALALDPQRPESVLVTRFQASLALGRLDLAEQDAARVRETRSDDANSLNSLCWIAAKAGVLLDQALKDCDAALALAPASAAILDSRCRVLLQLGDTQGALAAYDAALAKAPELPASLYGRGLARIAAGRIEDGEADKAAAIEIDPDIADSFKSYPPLAQAAPAS